MIDKRFFEEISQQIAKLLPQASAVGDDVKKTVSSVMQKGFERLDLLTREEFDSQQHALARAEERIAQLEGEMLRLEELVSQINAPDHPDTESKI